MENYKKGEKGLSMQPDFSIIFLCLMQRKRFRNALNPYKCKHILLLKQF